MSTLHERLARVRQEGVAMGASPDEVGDRRPHRAKADPLAGLRQKAHRSLVEALGPKLYDSQLNVDQLQAKVREKLHEVLDEEQTPLTREQRRHLVAEIADDVLGFGPIESFLRDPTVTEIM